MALPWDQIAAFLAVIREGSLSGAARRLGAAQPTVRRQIEALESQIGVSLFMRGPAGLLPTETSLGLVAFAESMEASAAAFVRTASGDVDSETGTVRLTCSRVFGIEILPSILADLRRKHPAITIELTPTDRNEDLLRREADIAVRIARPAQDALVARQVARIPLGFFASPTFLADRDPPSNYHELADGFEFIGADRDPTLVRGFTALGMSYPRKVVYRTDDILAQIAAIRAGVGVGLCQVRLGAASGLVRLVPEMTTHLEAWVVMHEDLKRIRRVRIVFDHLVAALS